jgi:hypothetical protein
MEFHYWTETKNDQSIASEALKKCILRLTGGYTPILYIVYIISFNFSFCFDAFCETDVFCAENGGFEWTAKRLDLSATQSENTSPNFPARVQTTIILSYRQANVTAENEWRIL